MQNIYLSNEALVLIIETLLILKSKVSRAVSPPHLSNCTTLKKNPGVDCVMSIKSSPYFPTEKYRKKFTLKSPTSNIDLLGNHRLERSYGYFERYGVSENHMDIKFARLFVKLARYLLKIKWRIDWDGLICKVMDIFFFSSLLEKSLISV